jgi:hypothetical protein
VTSSLLAPWRSRRGLIEHHEATGSTAPTAVLDHTAESVAALHAMIGTDPGGQEWLRRAHAQIRSMIRPVYALDDLQPASSTITKGRGSCSQRLAILEAVARRHGIATRVEGIVVGGQFWYPRFPRLRWLVPERVILAWPEFLIDGQWIPIGELFDADPSGTAFANAGEETLFDAISRTGIAWTPDCAGGVCDLSGHVLERLGHFDDRDALFAAHGQTICRTARVLGGPVMGRRAAGAR